MDEAPAAAWSRLQRALHGWTAALVVVTTAIGWWMLRIPDSALLLKFLIFQLHKTIGLTILGIIGLRLWLRLRRGRPDASRAGLPRWQRRAASLVHGGLYALLIAGPVAGYLAADTAAVRVPTLFFGIPLPAILSPDPGWFAVLSALHGQIAAALVLLAGGHTAAALFDQWRGHATLRTMWVAAPPGKRRSGGGAPSICRWRPR